MNEDMKAKMYQLIDQLACICKSQEECDGCPLDGDDNQLWVWDTCLDQCVCVNAEEGIPHWWQMDLTDLEHAIDRLKATLEYHRRIESLQEITKRIRNYVATFGSFWLENIVDADGRVSFRDIADSIGYEISHLERSVDE